MDCETLRNDDLYEVAKRIDGDFLLPFALASRALRDAVRATGRPMKTNLAAYASSPRLAAFALRNGCSPARLQDAAAEAGSVEVLDLCEPLSPAANRQLCWRAAEHNRLPALAHLRALGSPWDESVAWEAARGGHLALLQWARSQDPPCPWDEWTAAYAAHEGHLELLQWARKEGVPWGPSTWAAAGRGGHGPVLEWLEVSGCPIH